MGLDTFRVQKVSTPPISDLQKRLQRKAWASPPAALLRHKSMAGEMPVATHITFELTPRKISFAHPHIQATGTSLCRTADVYLRPFVRDAN